MAFISPQSDHEDAELVRATARGDERAFGALYDRYASILFGLLLRILRSRTEAEDVLQEVFIQVWQRASNFDADRGRPFTWLVLLTRSRALDRLRAIESRDRAAHAPAREDAEEVSDALADAERSEEREAVRGALDLIPAEQRRALLLAYFEGLSQSEIAERTGQPLGTVKTRMRSGMLKLRELLKSKAEAVRTNS